MVIPTSTSVILVCHPQQGWKIEDQGLRQPSRKSVVPLQKIKDMEGIVAALKLQSEHLTAKVFSESIFDEHVEGSP